MTRFLARYAKFIVAGVAAGAVTAQAAISDGTITGDEWWKVGIAAAGAVFVFGIPNAPPSTGLISSKPTQYRQPDPRGPLPGSPPPPPPYPGRHADDPLE